MIGRLRGVLAERHGGGVTVEVGGVGYEVSMTPRGMAELPSIGEDVVVHTHLHGREDGITLFGFPSAGERDLFRVLLGASGVGPKVALAICATLTRVELTTAVLADDTGTLELVPGIGKRSAQKLILELRPKLDLADGDVPGEAGSALAEVRQALDALGYQPAEVKEALAGLDTAEPVADMLRRALQALGSDQ